MGTSGIMKIPENVYIIFEVMILNMTLKSLLLANVHNCFFKPPRNDLVHLSVLKIGCRPLSTKFAFPLVHIFTTIPD